MTTIGGLFNKYSSLAEAPLLCARLHLLLEGGGSPKETKCTKRVYSCMVRHLDSAVARSEYAGVSTLFKSLAQLAKGSKDHSTGFSKFISFGLPQKVLSWCEALFARGRGQPWEIMVDSVLFHLVVVLGILDVEDQQEMVSLVIPLLKCVCSTPMPHSAKIEAVRGCNILLEVCTVEFKNNLNQTPETKQLILNMGRSVARAGNFELQVSTVECLYRMTSASERVSMAKEWFKGVPPSVVQQFNYIRELEFEVDCREFLNGLNSSLAERTVYSLSCVKLQCGETELHCPQDETHFWVDFNTSSSSITVYVEDPASASTEQQEGMWEMITIREPTVKSWTTRVVGGEYVLMISLKEPAHSLLPSLSSTPSHEVTIRFNSACNPALPTKLVLGARKQATVSSSKHVKQSSVIKSVHINQKSNQASKRTRLQEISPIEVPPDTPALGEHVNSQGSNTTPTNKLVLSTPATSTPKPKQLRQVAATSNVPSHDTHITPSHHTTPISSGRRQPLSFISNGTCVGSKQKEPPKASTSVKTVVLGKGQTRVVQTSSISKKTMETTSAKMVDNDAETDVYIVEQSTVKRGKQSTGKAPNAPRKREVVKQPTTTPTAGWTNSNQGGRKRLSQLANFKHLDSPEDINSPVLDYDLPTETVRKKLQPSQETVVKEQPLQAKGKPLQSQELKENCPVIAKPQTKAPVKKSKSAVESMVADPYEIPEDRSSVHSTPLAGVSNESSKSRKAREFNLSGVSKAHAKKCKKTKKSTPSRDSSTYSLNNTCASEVEPFAIPDSLPTGLSPSQKAQKVTSRRKPPRLNLSMMEGSDQDSDEELDQDWNPVNKKIQAGRVVNGKSQASKQATTSCKPAMKAAAKKTSQASNASKTAKSGHGKVAKPRVFKTQAERQQFINDIYGDFTTPDPPRNDRKRVIDEIYEATIPDYEAPKAKVTKSTAPTVVQQKTNRASTAKTLKLSPKVKPRNKKKLPVAKKTRITKKPSNVVLEKGQKATKKVPTETSGLKSDADTKTYGSKNSRKRPVIDHDLNPSDFDILLQSKRHCPEKQLERSYSPIQQSPIQSTENSPDQSIVIDDSPNQSLDVELKQPVYTSKSCQKSPVHTSPAPVSPVASIVSHGKEPSICSNNDLCSPYIESIKDKILDTQPTENAALPAPTSKHRDSTPSPSVSVHSSQITADLNITAGFQQICQALISKSGNIESEQPMSRAKEFPRTLQCDDEEPIDEERSVLSDQSDLDVEEDHTAITLTQFTRDIINSHKVDSEKIGSKRTRLAKERISKPATAQLKPTRAVPERKRLSLSSKQSSSKSNQKTIIVNTHEESDNELLSDTDTKSHLSVSTSSHPQTKSSIGTDLVDSVSTSSFEGGGEARLLEKRPDMRDIENLFGCTVLQSAKRGKQRKMNSKTTSDTTGELLNVFCRHQGQRESTLTLHRDQLLKELEILEKDVQRTQDTEKQTVHLMKKRLKALKESAGSQQKQVDRLRVLQVSFHQHLGKLEENQSAEQHGAHKSLKQEMHILHKRLLADYERKEIAKVKKTLHAMLLQV